MIRKVGDQKRNATACRNQKGAYDQEKTKQTLNEAGATYSIFSNKP